MWCSNIFFRKCGVKTPHLLKKIKTPHFRNFSFVFRDPSYIACRIFRCGFCSSVAPIRRHFKSYIIMGNHINTILNISGTNEWCIQMDVAAILFRCLHVKVPSVQQAYLLDYYLNETFSKEECEQKHRFLTVF